MELLEILLRLMQHTYANIEESQKLASDFLIGFYYLLTSWICGGLLKGSGKHENMIKHFKLFCLKYTDNKLLKSI